MTTETENFHNFREALYEAEYKEHAIEFWLKGISKREYVLGQLLKDTLYHIKQLTKEVEHRLEKLNERSIG